MHAGEAALCHVHMSEEERAAAGPPSLSQHEALADVAAAGWREREAEIAQLKQRLEVSEVHARQVRELEVACDAAEEARKAEAGRAEVAAAALVQAEERAQQAEELEAVLRCREIINALMYTALTEVGRRRPR